MGNKIAITGATNNPGKVLIEYISRNIEELNTSFPGGIVSLQRPSSDTSHYKNMIPNGEIALGDLGDRDYLSMALSNVDTIIHVAGIRWSREIVDIAAEKKVRRLIAVHTCGVYSKYKRAGEIYRQIDDHVYKVARENNIYLTILRPTMIYGNKRDRNIIKFIRMVDKFPLMPVVSGGKYKLQPVHYKDLGKAFFDVLINEQSTINKDFILSGREPILLKDMFSEIGNNLGKKVRFVSCPFWLAYLGAWLIYLISFGKKDFREKVQRLCEDRAFSHNEASLSFGYSPMSFSEGIVDEVREYRGNISK